MIKYQTKKNDLDLSKSGGVLLNTSHFYKKFFYFFSSPYIKKMSNLTIKERKSKFSKLSNSLNIKLIK